jgi:hypothetical protein
MGWVVAGAKLESKSQRHRVFMGKNGNSKASFKCFKENVNYSDVILYLISPTHLFPRYRLQLTAPLAPWST